MASKRKKKSALTPASSSGRVPAGQSAVGGGRPLAVTPGGRLARVLARWPIEVVIFLTLFIAYAYFCQGGGWNQNARFDQVRAIVEAGRLSINGHMVYGGQTQPGRAPRFAPGVVPPEIGPDNITQVANSGDVAKYQGRFYPNKPPGVVFAAVPAYFLVHAANRLLGNDILKWSTLTVSFYFVVVLSVGLAGALAGVGYYRLARELFPDVPSSRWVAATFTFGLGTMMFPFSTLFFDHVIVAGLLLWSLLLLVWAQQANAVRAPSRRIVWLLLAGLLIGFGVTCNYLVGLCAILYSLYLLWVLRPRGLVLFFWLGSVLPGVLLAWYHHACFGSVFATANAHEAKMFESQHLWLGFFGIPQPAILGKLLFSEYRGLFITSPVLILAALAVARMLWRKQVKPEIILCGAVFVMFLAINSAFQGEGWDPWSGGWSFGPRYLIPGVALLAVALVPAFNWLPRLTGALAVASAAIMLLGTAVDPQPPMGILKPLADYILPLASGTQVLIANNPVFGPVSANPMGVYESWYYRVFPPGSREARWNSFNLGELIFPDSLLSLAPLIAILAAGVWLAWRGALAEGLGKPGRVVQGKIKSAG